MNCASRRAWRSWKPASCAAALEKYDDLREALPGLRGATGDNWHGLKDGVEAAWHEFRRAFEAAKHKQPH